MKLDVLLSCMHQTDATLIDKSNIVGDAIVINQCDTAGEFEYSTERGNVKFYSVTDRGLTKSRNMAIKKSNADVCLLCDDDEQFVTDYDKKIIDVYKSLPEADVVIFKMANKPCSFSDKVQRIKFPKTMKVSSWQISFRRKSIVDSGVWFDELLGAGTGNGAEEELKFLLDCQRAGLRIYYVPVEIATVAQEQSTWFNGFDETFFENRGATTRYILGFALSSLYAVYYIIKKRNKYINNISAWSAFKAIFKGIINNKITKQSKSL